MIYIYYMTTTISTVILNKIIQLIELIAMTYTWTGYSPFYTYTYTLGTLHGVAVPCVLAEIESI